MTGGEEDSRAGEPGAHDGGAAPDATRLFAGAGEMAARWRALDWAATPLGAVERWPQSLRTAAQLALGSAFASLLLWGPELVQLYNDGYVAVHGARHPGALGRPMREVWPELWERNAPVFARALAGETVAFTDAPPLLHHRDADAPPGDEPAVSLSIAPVRDERGTVRGVLVTRVDTTAVAASRRRYEEEARLRRALDEEREREQARLLELFHLAPTFLAVLRGPDHEFERVNEAYTRLVGRRDVVGRPAREVIPELREQGFVALLDRVLATGEPFVGHEVSVRLHRAPGAPAEERFLDLVYQPLTDPDGARGGVVVHGTDVTEQVRARRVAEVARVEAEAARERALRLQALAAALSTASTVDEVAQAVVAHATAVLGAVGTVIARVDADGEHLELMRAGAMPDDVRDEWRRFRLDAPAPLAEVARTGEPLFLESRAAWAERYPHLVHMLDVTGQHANAVAPLVVDRRVLGVMGAAYDEPRAFAAHERALTLSVAQQCAQALERARLFEAERLARQEAERANRGKGEFLAVMSHELRTPLNAIGGYAELMELGIRGPVTEQQREDLARIRVSQRHLLGLINEVLNYARIETGAVRYDVTDVDVPAVVASVEPLVAPQLAAKRLGYRAAAADTAGGERPLVARADREKLRQVLLNLLSNAIKFTAPGGRVVVEYAAAGDRVLVSVSDSGIGIPADQIESIFDPFVQVNASLTRVQEGTGLGLAISRDLARGMGGELTAASAPGAGSTFTLTLPRA